MSTVSGQNYFIFDGVSTLDYGMLINGSGVFESPEPDLEYVQIPGRNGNLIYDNNRFENIDVSYSPVFAVRDFRARAKAFQAWLLSHRGYYRLEDSYQPDYFRMASVREAIEVQDIAWVNNAGALSVTFDCKPQLYLKSGETVTTLTASGSVTNPTAYTALPLLNVYGTGTLTVGSVSIVIESHSYTYAVIDCETQDCYYGANNLNPKITIGDYFPTFPSGSTTITLGDGITKVEITPRWWTI